MVLDTSKLEHTGWRAFISWVKEWYHYEFTELSNEYKDNAIEYILRNNADIFTKEMVLAENLCEKCGRCCEEIGCPHYHQDIHLCSRHNNQESEICRLYPWDNDVGFILTLNCGYQKKFVLKYFDIFFQKAIDMRCNDGEKGDITNNKGLD